MKFVDPGRMGHVDKNDCCAVNKASGRNRSRQCVLYWSVLAAGAHAALLIRDGLLFCWFLLGKRGIQKKSRTNGLQCGGARKAPRFAGSREWHEAPAQSCSPGSIFAQSRQAGLTYGKEYREIYWAPSNHPRSHTNRKINKNGDRSDTHPGLFAILACFQQHAENQHKH